MASVVGSQKAEVQESKEDLGVLYILIFYKIAFLPWTFIIFFKLSKKYIIFDSFASSCI